MFNHNTTEETTNHIFKRKNVDVQQSVEEVDPTDYLRMLSENDDKAYQSNQHAFGKEEESVSPWVYEKNNSSKSQFVFKKCNTSMILPYCIRKPQERKTCQHKKFSQKKFTQINSCQTAIARFPSEKSQTKILIVQKSQNKQNEPQVQEKRNKKVTRRYSHAEKVSLKGCDRTVLKDIQWKNKIEMVSECARLKWKIMENIKKQCIVSEPVKKVQQKPPLPNSVKPLSRLLRKKRSWKQENKTPNINPSTKNLYQKYIVSLDKWKKLEL